MAKQKANDKTPVVGLALGSGGARGWAHIGVIRALEELGIRPQLVAGCSIGALVGSAWATDKLKDLEDWVSGLAQWDVIRLLDIRFSGGGVIGGERLIDFFSKLLGDQKIEDLNNRFSAVATDMNSGREVWLKQGDLLSAVRASIALPILFTPVKLEERWLLDGGLVNPVPVSLCRAMGADVVIAVNLNDDLLTRGSKSTERKKAKPLSARLSESHLHDQLSATLKKSVGALLTKEDGKDAPELFEVILNSIGIMQDRITRSRMGGDPPDVVITPRLRNIGTMEFYRAEECIEEGRDSVERARAALEFSIHTG